MPWNISRNFILFILSFSSVLSFAGGDSPAPQIDCNDKEIVLSNKRHPNPLLEEYRPSNNFEQAINHKFYAVQEGRLSADGKSAEIPVYAWFEKVSGYNTFTYFQRMDYFDLCGCYRGSCCQPVTIVQEQTSYVLKKRWIPWKDVCEDLNHPRNPPGLKKKILTEIKSENMYGLLERKGMPEDIVFLDRYLPYVYTDSKMPNEEWMSMYDDNGNPVSGKRNKKSASVPSKKLPSTPPPTIDESEELESYPGERIPLAPYNPDYRRDRVDLTPPAPAPQKNDQINPEEIAPAPQKKSEPAPSPVPPAPAPAPKKKPAAPAETAPRIDDQVDPEPAAPQPKAPAATKPATQVEEKIPTAKAVPGRPGFVFNPYATKQDANSIIDVTEFPAGSTVRDPATKKKFKTPPKE